MTALVNLVVGVALIFAYLYAHPTRQSGDVGREYVAVTQALADPKLPADARALLEMRRDTVAASIRAAYGDQLSFVTELVHKDTGKTSPSNEREIRVKNVSMGRFADYDWSVSHVIGLTVTPDEKDAYSGVLRFTAPSDKDWGGVKATLKSDPQVSHESLVVPN